jgi:hypothetical protein
MPLFCSHIYFGWPVAGATSPIGNIACSAPVSDRSSLRTRVSAPWASSFAGKPWVGCREFRGINDHAHFGAARVGQPLRPRLPTGPSILPLGSCVRGLSSPRLQGLWRL